MANLSFPVFVLFLHPFYVLICTIITIFLFRSPLTLVTFVAITLLFLSVFLLILFAQEEYMLKPLRQLVAKLDQSPCVRAIFCCLVIAIIFAVSIFAMVIVSSSVFTTVYDKTMVFFHFQLLLSVNHRADREAPLHFFTPIYICLITWLLRSLFSFSFLAYYYYYSLSAHTMASTSL